MESREKGILIVGLGLIAFFGGSLMAGGGLLFRRALARD